MGDQAPTLAELMLGVEGLAMLRLLYADAADQRAARVADVRDVVARIDHDPALAVSLGSEYGIVDGVLETATAGTSAADSAASDTQTSS